jgi:hypothetical protein
VALGLQTLHVLRLLFRQDFTDAFVDTELPRNGIGGALRVAGEHHDAHTGLLQQPNGVRRAVFDGSAIAASATAAPSTLRNTTVFAWARSAWTRGCH